MRIHILYFAYFRERLAMDQEYLDLPDSADVAHALRALGARHPCIHNMLGKFRVAKNQEFVPPKTILHDGDELALIPPVAGGSNRNPHIKIVNGELSVDRVVQSVSGDTMGGIVTFVGQVRNVNNGHNVLHLEYEAYGEMATKVMINLCQTIEQEIPGCRLAVEHRVGVLQIGEAAVVIAAAAVHRADAFTACRALIDRLKENVPIWKKETGPDGDEWIGLGP